jgi:hypothetical protein
MINRRQFIKNTSGALAFMLPATRLINLSNSTYPAPGVQLYTFHNVLDNDVKGTLSQVAMTGIKNIESAFSMKGDYYGMPAKQFGDLLKSLGITYLECPLKRLRQTCLISKICRRT